MLDTDTSDDSAADHGDLPVESTAPGGATPAQEQAPQSEADRKLVQEILRRIKKDKRFHRRAFARMDDAMHMAMHGAPKNWPKQNYRANIVGRHIEQKTAAIYAKNPKIVARRKEMLDFTVWDETLSSLQIAMQLVQTGMQAQAAGPQPVADPATGGPAFDPMTGGPAMAAPTMPPGYEQAMAIIADVQQGFVRRQMLKKFGKTLELVFAESMRAQTPLDFKSGMKALVRRALTNAAGYVEMGFQRQYGVPQLTTVRLEDDKQRLQHLEHLKSQIAEGEVCEDDEEIAELQASIAALEAQPQVVLRAGLTFDYHQSTKVIPDWKTKSLSGFVGANHITIEIVKPKCDIEEEFGVKLGDEYTPYNTEGRRSGEIRGVDMGDEDYVGAFAVDRTEQDQVCCWKHYDKHAGLVYMLVEGHSRFLTAPAAPDVRVPRFWPVYSLVSNPVESESEIFPLSDAERLADQQNEVNRSRQGKREHRDAARPRFAHARGALDEADIPLLQKAEPFSVIALNMPPDRKVEDLLQAITIPGVDPNLYDTNEVMQDASLTVGADGPQLGGLTKATATQAAIADGASSSSNSSSVDDLDAFLTMIARDGGQILMRELTKEEVVKIAGQGAVWVEDLGMDEEDIFNEVYLEIEAGSTGKPNQVQEIQNLERVGPLLLQIPGINPEWFARDAVRRFDDRIDLTEALLSGVPSMVAQNAMAQPAAPGGDPNADPNQQGKEGANNGPKAPGGPTGTKAEFGSNQV